MVNSMLYKFHLNKKGKKFKTTNPRAPSKVRKLQRPTLTQTHIPANYEKQTQREILKAARGGKIHCTEKNTKIITDFSPEIMQARR